MSDVPAPDAPNDVGFHVSSKDLPKLAIVKRSDIPGYVITKGELTQLKAGGQRFQLWTAATTGTLGGALSLTASIAQMEVAVSNSAPAWMWGFCCACWLGVIVCAVGTIVSRGEVNEVLEAIKKDGGEAP